MQARRHENHYYRRLIRRSLKNPGDYFTFRFLDESLAAVKDQDGKVKVLSTVCRHRGMEVVEGSGNKKVFTCPYHSWAYSLDGQLVNAPEMQFTAGFNKSDCSLARVRTEIWEGFIFINFDNGAKSLPTELGELSAILRNYGLADLETVDAIDLDGDWNWKLMVENFMEPYHVLGLHAGSHDVMPIRLPSQKEYNFRFRPYNGIYEIGVGSFVEPGATFFSPGIDEARPGNSKWVPSLLPPIEGLTQEERRSGYFILVHPTLLLVMLPEGVMWGRVSPLAVNRIKWMVNFCFPPATVNRPDFKAVWAEALKGLNFINDQDMFACAATQRGLGSGFAAPGNYSALDTILWNIHRYIIGKVTAN